MARCENNVETMFWLTVALVLGLGPRYLSALICSRYPANTFAPKSPVDENFVLSINGNPQNYILGQAYNVSIQAFNGLRYISFKLALENDNGDASFSQDLGHFELSDTIESRFSPNCINMVESTNTNPKTRVDVAWMAPQQPGSGCVLIRATLLQHRDVWYMDDGGLTKRICEETVDDVESSVIDTGRSECCTCDEARYELVFEGAWSRNHHPKDFPAKGWTTRFSDIVGAAHTSDYRFWEYGKLATEGIKELAEHGSTKTLEREFNYNFKNGKIRTIIKARGPAFPNLNGQSVASIRVDPQHHLLSLASKIDPSPDWIVGVSGLELCMLNCTWLEQKTITMYPWDVGTDAGPSYTSADQPQVPADVIRRMRSDFPNDPRSPFYDESGAPMKPLAILKIRRQRLYERLCDDEDSNNGVVSRECFTHPWSMWSQCSAKCGEGRQYRTRVYKQSDVARIYNCDVETHQDRGCVGRECGTDGSHDGRKGYKMRDDELTENDADRDMIQAECQLTGWGPWSECSKTCGEGKMVRERQYLNPMAERKCQSVRFVHLSEVKKCFGRVCLGEIYQHNEHERQTADDDEEKDHLKRNNEDATETEIGEQRGAKYYSNWRNKDINTYENQFRYPSQEDHRQNGEETNDEVKENEANIDVQFQGRPYNEDAEKNMEEYQIFEDANENETRQFSIPNRYEHQTHFRRTQYKNPYNQINTGNMGENSKEDLDQDESSEVEVPVYCLQTLKMFKCLDLTVVGNFWFYNYCNNECMLYAADTCDQNENKFTSLELCEQQCNQPATSSLLKMKQAQDCFEPSQRRKSRRRYGGF